MKEKKHVGIWIRVSTDDQAKGESPEHHEQRARQYADFKGWKVVTTYNLSAISGKSVLGHPEAERMLRDIKEDRISGLIFSKLARLARNTKELLSVADFFEDNSADLVSLQESIDTSTPAGRFFYTLIAAMAQWEREEIVERIKASVGVRAKLGKNLGGKAIYGYQWVDGTLVPHPDEAPVRRLIYEYFREEKRIGSVARRLNDAGYRTSQGKRFTDNTIKRLIIDTTAKGKRRANYSNHAGSRKDESEWVFVDVEPIVSEELWDECNQIIAERKLKKKPARKSVHIFSGRTYCSVCGVKMYPTSNTKVVKYRCKKCWKKIPTETLERIFHSRLQGFTVSEDEVAAFLSSGDAAREEKETLLSSLERERGRLVQETDKLYALYLDDQLSKESFGKRHRPLEERLEALGTEIPRLRGEIDYLRVKALSGAEVVSQARDLSDRWFELPREDRRAIVEAMVERIEVGDGEIEIELVGIPSDRPPPDETPSLLKSAVTSRQTLAGVARPSLHYSS